MIPDRRTSFAHTHALGACLLLASLASSPAFAASSAPDTLSMQVVSVDRLAHRFLLESLLDRGGDPEALYDKVSQIAGGALVGVEATCRSNLMPRYSEPGSPWIGWRLLARVRRDSCDWFIGALSCADTLCGALVTHERLAMMSITQAGARIVIAPGQPSTIGDDGTTQIDSVALFKGSSHILLQARRRFDTQHPCYDGPEHRSSEAADFFVLRGDRVLQAFTLDVAAADASHNDVDGDSGRDVTGKLTASATGIQLDRRTDEWQESADRDPKKTQHKVQESRVRLRFRDGAGLYLGADAER
jgi:hypothetical protein